MTKKQREKLIDFIVESRAYLEDLTPIKIDRDKWAELSDVELEKEADWYDWLLNK